MECAKEYSKEYSRRRAIKKVRGRDVCVKEGWGRIEALVKIREGWGSRMEKKNGSFFLRTPKTPSWELPTN